YIAAATTSSLVDKKSIFDDIPSDSSVADDSDTDPLWKLNKNTRRRHCVPWNVIADYFYDKLRLCQALQLSFTETRDHVIMGIRSQELAVYAMSRDHHSSATLLADLREWQRLYELRRTQFPMISRTHVVTATKTTKYEQRNTNTRRTADKTPSISATTSDGPTTSSELPKTSSVRCYNCGGTGHISRDCPRPRKPCSGCQSTTHSRGQCTVNPRKVAPPAETYRVEPALSYPKANCFIKSVLFNDIRATCLIDTGSSSVVSPSADQPRRTFCVGNPQSETTADVVIDDVSAADHPVLVVSDDSIPVDVIVGRTWLNLPHISYYKRQDELVIETLSVINSTALSENVSEETTDVHAALVSADKPTMTPLLHTDVKIDPGVTDAERSSLMTLINEYRDVFARTLAELGCTDVMKMNIDEVQGSDPVRQKPYRTSPTDRRTIARILDEWKSAGIISDSTSPYASPVLLVNKGTGEKRLCVDYRRLNQQTQDQPYPMPDIDDLLSQLVEGRIFSTMDLSNGFLQIPLTEEGKEKTAFVTEETTARFERMPFGLKGTPGMFQRIMNTVFKELLNQGLIYVYLDDIIIPSKDWEDMLVAVRRVFDSLRAAKLTLKPAKCTFGANELDFLGFTVTQCVIRPGRKVHAIKTFPQPRDAHEVRRFLDLTGYFRRFIVNYARLATPLTLLTGKDVAYEWGEAQQGSFTTLRELLCGAPVVRMFNPKAAVTQVHTDASAVALSGILLQGPTTTDLHMVYEVSKKNDRRRGEVPQQSVGVVRSHMVARGCLEPCRSTDSLHGRYVDKVRFMQQGDTASANLINLMKTTKTLTKHEKSLTEPYELHDGVLYRKHAGRSLLVVPRSMRKGIVIGAHDNGGHFSLDRTIAKITEDYWFTGLRRYVKQHIQMCLDCLVHKVHAGKNPGYLHPIPTGRRPFEVVHIDHLGPFETSATGNKYLLVLVDNLTKYTHLYPYRTTDTTGVLNRLTKFCDTRGIPGRIISDRGTCFTGKAFGDFCLSRGIRHTLNSTRHPQANGQVERANRTIVPLLAIMTSDQTRWDERIPELERHLNSAVNKTSTRTPFEALHGYRPRYVGGVVNALRRSSGEWTDPNDIQDTVRDAIATGQANMKAHYDRKRCLGTKYEVGEVVVMLQQPRPDQPTKLQAKYREKPLHVMKVLPGDTYRVAEVTSDGRKVYATTAHTSQLKSWKILQHADSEDEVEEEDRDGDVRREVEEEDQNGDVRHDMRSRVKTAVLKATRLTEAQPDPTATRVPVRLPSDDCKGGGTVCPEMVTLRLVPKPVRMTAA
ncbi:CCHC-type domain-containing protein, partial [Aphis craccivora]